MATEQKTLSQEVREIMSDSLFRDDEIRDGKPPEGAVVVDGLVSKYAMHPGRLNANKARIAAVLREMPDMFMAGSGGGWSFLNLCDDKHGNQWAEHPTMEALCVLAIGSGQGAWCMPREFWPILPGGVPYVSFNPQ